MFGRFLRKRRAKRFGIRFYDRKFWPYYFFVSEKGMCDGCKLPKRPFHPKAPSGVYPLLISDTHLHCYKVLRSYHMPGGDWGGVSNVAHEIEYHHSERRPPRNSEDVKD